MIAQCGLVHHCIKCVSGHGESGRDRHTCAGHDGQAGALAAQTVVFWSFCAVKSEGVLSHGFPLLGPLNWYRRWYPEGDVFDEVNVCSWHQSQGWNFLGDFFQSNLALQFRKEVSEAEVDSVTE